MKTTKLNVALAMSFAAILVVSGYIGYIGEKADGVNNFKSHIYLADCDDTQDDLCADKKLSKKEIRETISAVYSLDVDKSMSSGV